MSALSITVRGALNVYHAIEQAHYGDDVASMAWAGGVRALGARSLSIGVRARARCSAAVRSVGRRARVAKRSAGRATPGTAGNSCADFIGHTARGGTAAVHDAGALRHSPSLTSQTDQSCAPQHYVLDCSQSCLFAALLETSVLQTASKAPPPKLSQTTWNTIPTMLRF